MEVLRSHPNAESTKMGDGTVYKADHNGLIHISDRHASEIRSSYNWKTLGLYTDPHAHRSLPEALSNQCPKCLFANHDWVETCRCGHKLKEKK